MTEIIERGSSLFDVRFGTLHACLSGSTAIRMSEIEAQHLLDEVLMYVHDERSFHRVRPLAQKLNQSLKLNPVAERLKLSPSGEQTESPFPQQFL